MKFSQWFAFGIVLLLVAEILVIPEAQAWGRRRRRWSSRRRRWVSRRRRWSSRRRRWFRRVGKVFRSVGRGIVRAAKAVGRVVHKAVVSKVGGYIIGGISFVNGLVGNACCTAGVVTPPGALCCGVTRGIAGVACGLNTYRAAHFTRKKEYGNAALSAAGAGGACFQAATGVTAFKAGWDLYKAGRKRRAANETVVALPKPAPCGKEHLAKDLGRLKMMMCSIMELRSTCKAHAKGLEKFVLRNMTNLIAGTRLFLTLTATAYKNTGVMTALKETVCKNVRFLPYCHHTQSEAKKIRESIMTGRILGYDPALSVCRHSLPGEKTVTNTQCRNRMTYAFSELNKVMAQLTNDVAAMHKTEFGKDAVKREQKNLAKNLKEGVTSNKG